MQLTMSPLPKTWIFDLDGTLVTHNAYKTGEDVLLPGVLDFLKKIPLDDYILIITGREKEAKEQTIKFLNKVGIRFNEIIFEMPLGERILINDDKPSGLQTSFAVRLKRNEGLENLDVVIDENL